MSDIINLLPDSVANQIAAGEVVQRPASVVKELVENAIDAGATLVKVNIKDAGRTLIQVIDNGCGMSDTDARMAFERHATSKISSAEDIFAIRTMGFRGEALASIAAVAQVELKSKKHDNDIGTSVSISGSELLSQECVHCANGSNFLVKNLFFNIPARRKFLKANTTEFRFIIECFQRIVLTYPEVAFVLQHNEKEVYNLPKERIKQRIVRIFGAKYGNLIPVEVETSLATITGFIGKPEHAKKTGYEQFFFVNKRYMKHLPFHRRVQKAYEGLIQDSANPAYFLYFEIDPAEIDVNIHPTKTEIKFTSEWDIAQILEAGLREALGKFNLVPSLDFNDDTDYNDMFAPIEGDAVAPTIDIDENFNPFTANAMPSFRQAERTSVDREQRQVHIPDFFPSGTPSQPRSSNNNWSQQRIMSRGFSSNENTTIQSSLHREPVQKSMEMQGGSSRFIQIKARYIAMPVKSGLMIIDQHRAHERILYEQYLEAATARRPTQNLLYPESVRCTPHEYSAMCEFLPMLQNIGFDIEPFGEETFVVRGVPAGGEDSDTSGLLHTMLANYLETGDAPDGDLRHKVACSLAQAGAISYGTVLSAQEMQKITDDLFSTKSPNISPTGKKLITILDTEELLNKFQ